MYRPIVFVLALSVFLTACGGDDDSTGPPSGPPQITGVSPDPLIEGQDATISGSNFASNTASNMVVLDGVPLPVSAATSTSLTVTIPSGCGLARVATLEVSVFSLTSGPINITVNPDPNSPAPETVSLAVGEQAVFHDTSYCFNLGSGPANAQYLLGVQSTGTSGNTVRGVTVQGILGTSTAAPARSVTALPSSRLVGPEPFQPQSFEDPFARMYRQHRLGHTALMENLVAPVREPMAFRGAASLAQRAPARVVVDGTENVWDQKEFRVRRLGRDCSEIATGFVTAELRATTATSMWWTDVDNPPGGFTNAQFDELAALFDNSIYATEVAEYGAVTDLDGNGRIVIIMTKQINSDNASTSQTIGFVNPCDFLARDVDGIHTSNEGEFFYTLAPDPDSTFGQFVDPVSFFEFLPLVIAHEFTHIFQFGRRIVSPTATDLMALFVSEGQATLSEEIVGHSVLSNTARQNLNVRVALNLDSLQAYPWYLNPWVDMVYYFGWPADRDADKIEGAPQECTWIASDSDHPCGGRSLWYGVTWSLLRWLSDQYGDALGGEAAFQTAIIDGDRSGFDNLGDVLAGQGSFDDLLAQWAATLYMDDRPGAIAPLTMSSWDLRSVADGLLDTAWLHPTEYGFVNFADDVTIRDPSTAYFLVGGNGAPQSYTVRVGATGGGDMSQLLQVWLVRTQ